MLRLSLALLLVTLSALPAASQSVRDATQGQPIPDVEMTGDDGRVFRLSSLAGKPIVLSPIFTRCPHACIMITTSLRDALLAIGEPGVDYEVVTFTFDPEDALEDLKAYRELHDLPDSWRMARADSAQLDSLLTTMYFSYTPEPGGFVHSNLLAFLTPELKISGYVTGIAHEEEEIRRALLTAVAPTSLVEKYKPLMMIVAGIGFLTIVVVLVATKRKNA